MAVSGHASSTNMQSIRTHLHRIAPHFAAHFRCGRAYGRIKGNNGERNRGFCERTREFTVFSTRALNKMGVSDQKKGKFLTGLAETNGVAVVVLDDRSREAAAANNNSICRVLWDSVEFAPRCAEFCGRAFAKTRNGDTHDFECHAGLICRAVPVEDNGKRFVAIVGRTFTSAEKYRLATEKAIGGEWSGLKPSDVFSNVLMSGSMAGIEGVEAGLEKYVVRESPDVLELDQPVQPQVQETSELDEMVRRFNETAPAETTAAEPVSRASSISAIAVSEYRSLVGKLMRLGYREACAAVLDHIYDHNDFSSVIWFERRGTKLEALMARGEFFGRPVRVALPADNERLIEAADNARPLILRERASGTSGAATRTLSLFPVRVGNEIRFAIAAEGEITDEKIISDLLRVTRSVASQIEILRLRGEAACRDSLAVGLKRFNESLSRVDADDFWMQVTQRSAELLGAERASLLILDETNDKLRAKAAIGSAIDLLNANDVGGRIARQTLDLRRPITVDEMGNIGVESAPREWRYRTSSFISYPISVGERGIGVMNFTDRADGGNFSAREMELLNSIVPQIAVAIDRTNFKRKAGEFEQRSLTDALTGLRNRGYLEERLTEEISQARRYRSSMCLIMIDVDNFKSYNDSFGHPAGDAVLKSVANVFRETLRTADVAARYGGEEFAILLPHTAIDEATVIAERIRQQVERTEFDHRRVTISLGIASYSKEFDEPKDWITAADMALYEVKENGRNGIRTYEQLGRSFREKIN